MTREKELRYLPDESFERRINWDVFTDDCRSDAASIAKGRELREQGKLLEAQIEAAADRLVRRLGALAVLALIEGRSTVQALADGELDFLDDLPHQTGGYPISETHMRMLKDMRAVRYRLHPLCVKSAGPRPTGLTRRDLWSLHDRLNAALMALRGPTLGDVLGHALMRETG